MNRDLFLAILAMDSYNRGYGRGIKFSKTEGANDPQETGTIGGSAIRPFLFGEQEGIWVLLI